MKSHPELGAFVRKSAVSKMFLYFSYVILILFTGLSLFIYFVLIIPISPTRYNGINSFFYYFIAFIMALGLIIYYAATYMSRGAFFYLYQNGVVSDNKGIIETLYFKDIRDLYLFTSGNRLPGINSIAFRKNSTADWHLVSARYSGINKVIAFIRSRHVAVYVPLLLKKLEEGHNVDFTYVDVKNLTMKQFTSINTDSSFDVKTKTVQVFYDKMVVDSQIIYFKEVLPFSVAEFTNQIQLIHTDERVIFKQGFTSVSSGDSFIALLDELINKRYY